MKYKDPVTNTWKTVYVKGIDNMPIGSIIAYPSNTIPEGWLLCNGSTFSKSLYPELYQVLGSTTLPDLRGKFSLGANSNYTLGSTGGEATHTLTIGEMPEHNHTYPGYFDADNSGYSYVNDNQFANALKRNIDISSGMIWEDNVMWKMNNTGGGQAHNNMPPYFAVNYIIKARHTITPEGSNENSYSTSTKNGYSCDYINNLNTYFTIEKRVGTWIDGKPLYKKTFNLGSTTTYSAPIANLKSIIKIEANAYLPDYSQYVSLPFSHPETHYNISLVYSKSEQQIWISQGTGIPSISEIYASIYYTKTTD